VLSQTRYPSGLLGLGLAALLASFMSGMAGNVTAFNTVWTYDIYQTYIKPGADDAHYLWMGRRATVFGTIAISFVTTPRDERDLIGLVYSLTPKQSSSGLTWYHRPVVLGVIVLVMSAALNVYFW